MEEIWKDIPDFKGYQASNLGRIRTFNKVTIRTDGKVRHWKNRIMKQKVNKSTRSKKRYDCRVIIWKDGKPYTRLVARLVASAFLGKSNLTVNHIDGNSMNNNIENLEWVSRKENIQKGFENGLYPQQNIKVINKITNEETIYRSMEQASYSIGHNHGYIHYRISHNMFENETYKWELI